MARQFRQSKWQVSILGFALLLSACKETILHDLKESQANEVKVTLSQAGIVAEKIFAGSGWNVEVPDDQATSALATLRESRVLEKHLEDVVEPPKGLIPSREERYHYLERQLALSLEDTLERIPQVLEARVHLYLQKPDAFDYSGKALRHTASVLLLVEEEGNPGTSSSLQETQIKQLIAGATNVQLGDITVIISRQSRTPLAVPTEHSPASLPSDAPVQDGVQAVSGSSFSSTFQVWLGVLLLASIGTILVFHFRAKPKPARKQMKPRPAYQPSGEMLREGGVNKQALNGKEADRVYGNRSEIY